IYPIKVHELEPAMAKLPADQELQLKERGLDQEKIGKVVTAMYPAAFYVRERSVDPRALTSAAIKTAKSRGVDFSSGDPVTEVNVFYGRVSGVTTTKTAFHASTVVNCAGAWAEQVAPLKIPTRPVRGQMLSVLGLQRDMLRHVLRAPKVYLVPRSDGRILIGASVEEVGYDKRTDPDMIQRIHRAAIGLVPSLRDARLLEAWAGLRPGSPDNLPILGATEVEGYFVATGHFRDGILLAPITAHLMSQLITRQQLEYDISTFSPARFAL